MEFILITNNPDVAKYAQDSGVHRIMVDLEIKGKKERQGHLNTVISNHVISDISKIRKVIDQSSLLVRINPIDQDSSTEINQSIDSGADILMLPMFTSPKEVKTFISYINGRVKSNLLLETPAAYVRIDEIVKISQIDEIHVGLNDLHLGFGVKFMFELLSGGIVEYLSQKVCRANILFGFGGIARLGLGAVDSKLILTEHYRLNSHMVILSRDFYDGKMDYKSFRQKIDLNQEIRKINNYYEHLKEMDYSYFINNKNLLLTAINSLLDG